MGSIFPFNAVQVDSGWYESSWFGTFKRANYNWIYHTELKWLFVEKSTSGNMVLE